MAFNTNAQAIAFMPTIRGSANAVMSAYMTILKETQLWTQLVMGNVIPNDANIVEDGNVLNPAVDSVIETHISDMNSLITFLQANSNAIIDRLQLLATSYNSQV